MQELHAPETGNENTFLNSVNTATDAARQNLLRLRHTDGHWAGELVVDSTLCADYIFYMHWDGAFDPLLREKCVRHIRQRQQPDGGWNIYHGGPAEINASVKAYFALKLAGHTPDEPFMQQARQCILRLGGIPRMNTYAKLYLALLGQFPWQCLPTIPVELVLFPQWLPVNLYAISSWSRAMLVPLAIINHYKPTRPLPTEKQIDELYPDGKNPDKLHLPKSEKFFSSRNFFLGCDTLLKLWDKLPWKPFRETALTRASDWMTQRMGHGSDGLAAVFPAMLNSIIALKAMGYSSEDPVLKKAIRDFEGLFVDDPADFRIQPCLSPVWDTAINIVALTESGHDPQDLQPSAAWLRNKEVRFAGDWVMRNTHPEASGWAFEYNNVFYPDTDDTAMALIALRLVPPADNIGSQIMFKRAVNWLLSFQCANGGWGAFDREITQPWLENIPFADHNAILDPTCSDLTGRILELLGYIGIDRNSAPIRQAVRYLRQTQEPDGSWYGRWGVNYLYGTWQVLRGLRAIGENMQQDWIQRACRWIESCQNPDGGWGESCLSYEDPAHKGKGISTPSQTAWAVMGLCAADPYSPHAQRGIAYLVQTQNKDGSWTEHETTGTGFPRVFYLKYDMYRNNFPLLALATWTNYRNGTDHPKSHYQWTAAAASH